MTSKYIIGDIHTEILKLKDNSIDLIYTNPPFNTTANEWDMPLNWETLFKEMWRVLQPNGVIALHSAIPFTYDLIRYEKPKYHYTWMKNNPTNFFHAKKQPLRNIEEVLIYYKKPHTYNPQMVGNKKISYKRNNSYKGEYYGDQVKNHTEQIGTYPTTFLGKFSRILQKDNPKSICDDITNKIIKTYTNPHDKILDMTCCNRNNGNLAIKLNRHYIGIDIREEFLKIE